VLRSKPASSASSITSTRKETARCAAPGTPASPLPPASPCRPNPRQIDPDELYDYLRYLGHKCRRVDCENMVWEVDENNDGGVDWDEFVTMFYRAKDDELGWEPRKLYNIVDFMMVDKDCSGTIDVDECMEILYRRFGKDNLEQKVNEFMALDTDDDDEPSIGFAEYMVGINRLSQIPDPGFKISQGMVLTTKEEIRKLILDINSTSTTAKPIGKKR
jgi:Ca2+-binding EF-hand superfamily protein